MPEYKLDHDGGDQISFSRLTRNLLAVAVVIVSALLAAIIPARAAVNIVDVRTGLHLNKTRLVLDIDRITTYRISYLETARSGKSPALREIIIDLPKSAARGPVMALARKAGTVGLLQRITVRNIGGSVRFRLFLRRMAGVDNSFPLKPYHGHGYRLVFDLAVVSAAKWRRLTQQPRLTKQRLTKPVVKSSTVVSPASKAIMPPSSAPKSSPAVSAEPPSAAVPPNSPDESGDGSQDNESYDEMVSGDSNFSLSGYIQMAFRGFFQSAMYPGQENWTTSIALEPLLEYVSDSGNSQFTFQPFGRFDVHDSNRSHFDIRELKWTGTLNRWQMTVGIDTIFWGVTESNHLVDIINQDDSLEDIDREDKLGQPLASLSYDSTFGVFSLYVMPYFRERRFPGRRGRLRLALPIDISQTQYEADSGKWHTDLAVRWSDVIGNVDVGLYQFRGTSRQPELLFGTDSRGNAVLIPRYNLINQTGLDLQGTFSDLLVKFEALRRTGSGRKFGAQNYWSMAGGFEYTFYSIAGGDSDIGVLAEYLYDNRGKQATTPFDDDLFMGIRWSANDIDGTQVLFGTVVDLQTSAQFVNFESSRRIGANWKVTLDARLFLNVPVAGFLYPVSRDDFFQLRLARYF